MIIINNKVKKISLLGLLNNLLSMCKEIFSIQCIAMQNAPSNIC